MRRDEKPLAAIAISVTWSETEATCFIRVAESDLFG